MASIDLLEELRLTDYYPQKLSFSEAIRLFRESQNGCPKKYGFEIVRRLLMFDSTAVDSVSRELNERLNNIATTETEIKGQCASDDVMQPHSDDLISTRKKNKGDRSVRKVHPMDLLVVVMNCCDDFLRQVLVEKMFANKLSVPILLPDVRNGPRTMLLLALKSLVPEVSDRIRDCSMSQTDTIFDVNNPIVSFIRVGNFHRSKSKLVNELLNLNSFNRPTFFHRDCPHGSVKRLVSNGSIEAAWFQSSTVTEEEFNCRFFTTLNLRGDARDYPKHTQFMCQSSTLVILMVDSFESFKTFYEDTLKCVNVSQTKIIVCYISSESPSEVAENNFELWNDSSGHGIIFDVKFDWNDEEKMSDADFTNELRESISKFLKPEHRQSNDMRIDANFSRSGKNFGFQIDEDKQEYKLGKARADDFIDLVLHLPADCKPMILPLQGEPWKKIGKLEREQQRKLQDESHVACFIAEKGAEKRQQREIQCRSLILQNEIRHKFSLQFHLLQDQTLLYYLNSCKIKLDARSRVIISKLLHEYKKEKQTYLLQLPIEGEHRVTPSEIELKIENSTIGLEHILREHGQMYEAVISEEIRMKEELKNAPLTPDDIRSFPTIVARLLLKGYPLELMDGDASNVPITWLKAVLKQVGLMTNNAKVFVLSIIGVQSSGKSTLLNALFGLQFPVSAGRCTRGIYCHLVPIDKGTLQIEYEYVLVVDTEGLRAPQFTGESTFRDSELATFAIGLADATIINMKGENWAEMKDILQIVAHGLVLVRKTKVELELMPRCMFVHQHVPATDAEERNRLGQEKQLMLLDTAIKEAASAKGFTDTNNFNDVIKIDPDSHSWYFPDLWSGSPPKAKVSQDYTRRANKLRQYLMQLMKKSPSGLCLTIAAFYLRVSDLWNAMLHNDFVLCFRNTQEIASVTVLNDKISHAVDGFENLNKPEQTKIREFVRGFESIEELRLARKSILQEVRNAVDIHFANMRATLQVVIDENDICPALKNRCDISFNTLRVEELRRSEDEMDRWMSVHMKYLEYNNDQSVKDIKDIMRELEIRSKEMEQDKLNEKDLKDFEERWQEVIAKNRELLNSRVISLENAIKETIRRLITELRLGKEIADWVALFPTPLVVEMPQVTENDICQKQVTCKPTRLVMDLFYSKSYLHKANSILQDARKKWDLEFKHRKDLEFHASNLERYMFEVGQLLDIFEEEHDDIHSGADEICSTLPPGCSFTSDYTNRFVKFACHYAYNQSLENSKGFIYLTDPLSDIDKRHKESVSNYQQMTEKANIDALSKRIFDYAKRSFFINLGELIKVEVCNQANRNPTFKSKRAFLRTILTDLGQRAHYLNQTNGDKMNIFKDFMLYVDLAESKDSKAFYLNVILTYLKEILTKTSGEEPESNFRKMVENNIGRIIEKAKNALRQADANCNELESEYFQVFKDCMNSGNEIDFRIIGLKGFTETVVKEINNLYDEFFSQANSSFETLMGEEYLCPLFEKIIGCREKCPFCLAPCSQSLQHHAGDHRADHYPLGIRGTVHRSELFTAVQDVTNKGVRRTNKLVLENCEAMVCTDVDIRTNVTVQTYNHLCYRFLNWNYHSFQDYKALPEYKNWDIPRCYASNTSVYWKWFMALFHKELAEHYKAWCEIPEDWEKITWEEASQSLDDPDLNS